MVGGGAAGASAARLLASWGYAAALLTGPAARFPGLAESLPPSIRKPLAALGLLELVESAGFLATRGNTAAWAGAPLRAVGFEGQEPGWQVERSRLDALLRGAAAASGALVVRGAALDVTPRAAAGGGVSEVRWSGEDGSGVLRARWVLDCSGRAGVIARRGLRVRQPGPATLALSGIWRRRGGWPLADESHTLVESYLDGWAWSVPVDGERRHVAVMVDPRATGLARGGGVEEMYGAELAKALHHRTLLDGAEPTAAPWACSATPYGASRHGGPGFLLVGDAGSFLDPLSSYGVKKALASAWLAAVVVHSALRSPAMEAPALALFEERERAAHGRYSELAARYYADADAHHRHPYWASRAAGAQAAAEALPAPAPDSDGVLRDRRIPAAFEYLRRTPRLRLRPAPSLRREWRPTVHDREVVLEEHLVSPAVPTGIRLARGVELPRLLDLVGEHQQVPDLYDAFQRRHAPVPLPDFLGALSALLALELVEDVPE